MVRSGRGERPREPALAGIFSLKIDDWNFSGAWCLDVGALEKLK
jgi:hypothetical protein